MSESRELQIMLDKAGEAFELANKYEADIAGWEEIQSSPEMTAYKRMTDEKIFAVKVSCYFEKPFEEIANYCWARWNYLELNVGDFMVSMEDVKTYEDGSILRREKTKNHGPVSAREAYIFTSKQEIDENNIIILSTSSPLEHPLTDGFVRPNITFNVKHFKPIGSDRSKTHLIFTDLVDPRGSIPKAIVNRVVTDRIKVYMDIVNHLKSL